jgi:hypothetical protein
VSLGLDHGENSHDDDEKKNNSHAGTLPVGAGVTYTNGAKTKRAGFAPLQVIPHPRVSEPQFLFCLRCHDMRNFDQATYVVGGCLTPLTM